MAARCLLAPAESRGLKPALSAASGSGSVLLLLRNHRASAREEAARVKPTKAW